MVRRRRSPKHTMVPAPNLFKSIWILTEELNKSITDLLGHKLLSNQSSDWPSPINILWQSGLLHHSRTPCSLLLWSLLFTIVLLFWCVLSDGVFFSNVYSIKRKCRITFYFFKFYRPFFLILPISVGLCARAKNQQTE